MIDARIAQALSEPLPSGDLAALLEDATREADAAREEFARAEAAALDPRSDPEAVAVARKAMDDARFRCDRIANAVSALNSRLDDVINREREAARSERRGAAEKRQMAAAQVLRDRYPVLAAELVEILEECQAADRAAHQVGLQGHSFVMAGWSSFRNPGASVRLPHPDDRPHIWPRR